MELGNRESIWTFTHISRDNFRLNLLPRKEVTINRHGIHFYKNIYYLRPPEIPFGQKNKVEIAYDPAFLDQIYIPAADGSNALICPLTPASKLYIGRDWQETEDLFAIQNKQFKELEQPALQANALFRARKQFIITRAKNSLKNIDEESNRSMLSETRDNRRFEKEMERNNKNWLSTNTHSLEENVSEKDEYLGKPSYLNLLKAANEENENEN